MEGETVGQEVSEGTGIDQSSMEADYMSSYQLVDNEGNSVENDNILEDSRQSEAKTQDSDKQPAQSENKDSTQQPDEYLKGFYREDGSLDVGKAMALFGRNTEQPKQEQPTQEPPVIPHKYDLRQPVEQPVGQPQQPVDTHDQLRKNVLAALEIQRYYMSQGDDANTAMVKAEREINEHLQQYFLKSEMQKMKDDFEKEKTALREEIKNERDVAIAEPQAQKNLMNICNKYANGLAAETLQKAIFDINIGGKFLLDLFGMQNPDKSSLVGEPLKKAMNDWFVKNAAKNNGFVEALAVNALNCIQAKVYPELAKIIQQNGAARATQQQKNNPGPKSTQSPAAHKTTTTSGPEHDLAMFFHEVPRDSEGRAHI